MMHIQGQIKYQVMREVVKKLSDIKFMDIDVVDGPSRTAVIYVEHVDALVCQIKVHVPDEPRRYFTLRLSEPI